MNRHERKALKASLGQWADFCYCPGSRSVADFIETIIDYRRNGDLSEADYWLSELQTLVPDFPLTILESMVRFK